MSWQLAVPAVPPGERSQLAEELKVPVPLLVKLTLRVGVVGFGDVSVTVAVHVGAWFTTTGPEQFTFVVVVLGSTP